MPESTEKLAEEVLLRHKLRCTRPDREKRTKANGTLDFHLTDFDLLVEVKDYACERMVSQIGNRTNVIVLVGRNAVKGFDNLLSFANGTGKYDRNPN